MPDIDQIIEDAMDNPILSETADEVGKNLLEAMIGELTLIPHPSIANQNVWSTRKQKDQEATIERFRKRIKAEVLRSFEHILADGHPAVRATLEKVVFSDKGIQGTLQIAKHSGRRHALADFAGSEIAIIMPQSLDAYFESMSEIVGTADQAELDLDAGVQSEEDVAAPEPSEDDEKLASALADHAVWVKPEIIAVWNSEWTESAWNWVEEMDKDEATPSLPSFLDEYVGDESGPVDMNSPLEGTGADALIEALGKVSITVTADIIATWSDDDRVESAEYAALISAGKLPKQIPKVIAPFLLGGDDAETVPA